MTTTTELRPAAAETCEPKPHAWAAHLGGGPIHIEICYLCKAINWDGIREQIAELAKAALPDRLRGDGPCQDCGTPDNIRWFAPNVVWNHVMGGTQAVDDPGGIVCVPCFVKRVDAAGFAPTVWQIAPNWFAAESDAVRERDAAREELTKTRAELDEEEAHAAGYDEGRADFKKRLLDDIETWKRQAGIGLVTGHILLEDMESWVKRS